MIGVIGAMKVEVDNIVALITDCKKVEIAKKTFFTGKISDVGVVVCECGVGKVNASVTTSLMCEKFNVNFIINTGVAGGIGDIKPLSLVIAKDFCYHDFDLSPIGYQKGVIPSLGKIFNTDDHLRELLVKIAECNDFNYTVGNIASGDIFATKKSVVDNLEMDIVAVEMEGAAIAHVCKLYDMPFIALRVISDIIEEENQTVSFNEVEKQAAEKALLFVCEIIRQIAIDKKNNNIV